VARDVGLVLCMDDTVGNDTLGDEPQAGHELSSYLDTSEGSQRDGNLLREEVCAGLLCLAPDFSLSPFFSLSLSLSIYIYIYL